MRIQLLHLDGLHRGRTITYGRLELLFGTAPEADVRYTEGVTVQLRHAQITFSEPDCNFYLKALEGEVFVNHNEVEEVVLEQNDLIEIGRLGPKLRFRVYAKEGRACKPVLQMIRDAREVGRRSGVFALTQVQAAKLKVRPRQSLVAGQGLLQQIFELSHDFFHHLLKGVTARLLL